ncbi:unnamed protein product [Soboliphyme baturini]|uniref:Uncharacterized protein n=1 Tax=Soboliphyme baturini TaxID=241478 RepID=A0A183J0I4_9BILA|nr:unnamed protein product [Soboliphyme baturini]
MVTFAQKWIRKVDVDFSIDAAVCLSACLSSLRPRSYFELRHMVGGNRGTDIQTDTRRERSLRGRRHLDGNAARIHAIWLLVERRSNDESSQWNDEAGTRDVLRRGERGTLREEESAADCSTERAEPGIHCFLFTPSFHSFTITHITVYHKSLTEYRDRNEGTFEGREAIT